MKKLTVQSLFLLCSLMPLAALANDPAPKGHPCMKIMEACKAAGFAKGEAKEGKGLFKNCLKPIREGKTVPGVTVDPATVQACKEMKSKHGHMDHEMEHSNTSH